MSTISNLLIVIFNFEVYQLSEKINVISKTAFFKKNLCHNLETNATKKISKVYKLTYWLLK